MTAKRRVQRDRLKLDETIDLTELGITLTARPAPTTDYDKTKVVSKPKPNSRTTQRGVTRRTKREKRPLRTRHGTLDAIETMEMLFRWPLLFELAKEIEATIPSKGVGRPREQPHFMLLAFPILTARLGSYSEAHVHLRNKLVWQICRTILERAWPNDPSRRLPSAPCTRYAFHRWRERLFVVQASDNLHVRTEKIRRVQLVLASYRLGSVRQAKLMGMLDPTKGSLTKPYLGNVLAGDGTHIPALFTGAEGDTIVDSVTGAIEQVRFDPDATGCRTSDGTQYVRGISFVNWLVSDPAHDGERVNLAFGPVGQGGEAATALELLERLADITELTHATYDMAWRGKHIEASARRGIFSIVKTPRAPHGRPSTALIGHHTFRDGVKRPLHAYDGTLCFTLRVGTHDHLVRLESLQAQRRPNGNGSFRLYGVFRVPNNPIVPAAIRGDEIRLRVDDSRKVADNVHFFNEHTELFDDPHGRRQSTEGQNNLAKQSLWNGRAHSVGRDRQTIDMLGFYLLSNLKAAVTFVRRTNSDPFGFGGGAIGPPGDSIAA